MKKTDPQIIDTVVTRRCSKIARFLITEIFHPDPVTSLAAAQTLQIVVVYGYPPMLRRQIAYLLSVLKHSEPDPQTRQMLTEMIEVLTSPHVSNQLPPVPSNN